MIMFVTHFFANSWVLIGLKNYDKVIIGDDGQEQKEGWINNLVNEKKI